MRSIPLLRAGKPYESLNHSHVKHLLTGQTLARLSLGNSGLLSRDLPKVEAAVKELQSWDTNKALSTFKKAAEHFHEELDLFGSKQTLDEYYAEVSGISGMPIAILKGHVQRLTNTMTHVEDVLCGLMGSETFKKWSDSDPFFPFRRESSTLGVVLPSNSPGVHVLWLTAMALKTGLVLKPGREEPLTPIRLIAALIKAGFPPACFEYFPTDHAGAREVLLRTNRSMLFGDHNTVKPWLGNPGVQIHGPGWSKIFLEGQCAEGLESYLDLMVNSVAANGGRSCINASGIWSSSQSLHCAQKLAERLLEFKPLPLDDPQAKLCAFSNPIMAERMDQMIEGLIAGGGARDVSLEVRGTPRLTEAHGLTFLEPTVIHVDSPKHPLVACEFLFPFVTVAPFDDADLQELGPTLSATVLSDNEAFINQMLEHPHIDRIHLGAIPTNAIRHDHPHEGNLFEHLFRQRSVLNASHAV